MAQVSIINLSEVVKNNFSIRLDAEYFSPQNIQNLEIIKKKDYILFQDIIANMTGGATPLGANYLNKGVKFLRVQNIMQNYIDDSNVVYISNEDDVKLKRSRLKENDVLLTITGVSYGKSCVVNNDYVDSNINQHSVRIEINNHNPYYISTFLNSKYGYQQSTKNIVGISRQALDYNAIKNFYIPICSHEFQNKIEELVKRSYKFQEESKELYNNANDIFENELDIKDMDLSNSKKFTIRTLEEVKNASDIFRIDAEFFQDKYDKTLNKILNYKHGFDVLKNIVKTNNIKYDRTRETNANYIEIGSINISNGTYDVSHMKTADLPVNAKISLFKDDLVISTVRPYRGAISIIQENGLVGSGAFCTINNYRVINKETLFIFFRSQAILNLSLKYNSGMSYPVIKDKDILSLPIPLIPNDIQKKISLLINESFHKQDQSRQLLEISKKSIEIAIEENEKQAMKYMTEKNITV